MKRLSLILSIAVSIFLLATPAPAADDVAAHKTCKICGMDRGKYKSSRVLIEYEDGGSVGLCSINCAAAELKSSAKPPKNILVADYNTGALIDARGAAWVTGGGKPGVMTQVAKWAFSDRNAARAFIDGNGGDSASYEQVLVAAGEETKGVTTAKAGGHSGHCGPGSQMLYNPAFGDDIYHNHPAGMWMVNYKFMHMEMGSLRSGTTDVSPSSVGPGKRYNYMMIPDGMSMDMHMVMVMYGITDWLTVMGMANYLANDMGMLMDMGEGAYPDVPMNTSGFGDTDLRAIFKINKYFNASLGLTIPTGSIAKETGMMGIRFRAPYDMQLGGGTFNLRPAVTYSHLTEDALWNWGAQAMYTYHVMENDNGWAYGDSFKLTWWLQRAFGPATGWLRMAYNNTEKIHGKDPEIQKLQSWSFGAPTPDADPANYGGERLDFLMGASYTYGPFSFGLEGGIPVYEYLHGLQMKTDWILTVGGQVMF